MIIDVLEVKMKTFKSTTAFIEDWCLWMPVTSTSWLIGYALVGYLTQLSSLEISNEVNFVIGLICGGVLLGLMQWHYLRPKVSSISTWVVVSVCGLTLGFAITTIVFKLTGSLFGAFISGAFGGLVLGVVQRFGLLSDARDKASWILVTTLGWALAISLGALIFAQGNFSNLPSTFQEIVGSWTIGSAIVSLVTIFAVVTLFPKSMSKDPRTPIKWSF